jgi:hypothetical protein
VSNLDVECFKTPPYVPPATAPIVTRHLNPVLAQLPAEASVLGVREKLCVPVGTNGMLPPSDVLGFTRFVNLACYRTTGATVNTPLQLRHLNPTLTTVPPKNFSMLAPPICACP